MSEFDKFCSAVKKTAGTIASKTGEAVDHASTKLKIKGLQLRMEEKYEKLGRLVYQTLRTGECTEEERNRVLAELDALRERIEALQAAHETKDATEESAAPQTNAEAAPQTDDKAPDDPDPEHTA